MTKKKPIAIPLDDTESTAEPTADTQPPTPCGPIETATTEYEGAILVTLFAQLTNRILETVPDCDERALALRKLTASQVALTRAGG